MWLIWLWRWWQKRIKTTVSLLSTSGLRNCWACSQRTTGATSACPTCSLTETTAECSASPGRANLVRATITPNLKQCTVIFSEASRVNVSKDTVFHWSTFSQLEPGGEQRCDPDTSESRLGRTSTNVFMFCLCGNLCVRCVDLSELTSRCSSSSLFNLGRRWIHVHGVCRTSLSCAKKTSKGRDCYSRWTNWCTHMSEPVFCQFGQFSKAQTRKTNSWEVSWAHWGTFRKYTAPIISTVYVQEAENKKWATSCWIDIKTSQKSSANMRIKHQ